MEINRTPIKLIVRDTTKPSAPYCSRVYIEWIDYSACKDKSLSSFSISANEWDIVDNIIHDTGNTGNINEQDTYEPDEPMSPQEFQLYVDSNTHQHHSYEAEEHQ